MNTPHPFNDFSGLLGELQGAVMDGHPPTPTDRQRLFAALSYAPPSDVPGGLAAITELTGTDPDEIQAQYDAHIADQARQCRHTRPQGAVFEYRYRPGSLESRSDKANAMRMVTRFFDRLRFCPDTNRWLIWNGTHWAADETGEIYQYAAVAVQEIYKEAGAMPTPAERKAHAAWALRSESKHGLDAMVSLARFEQGIAVRRAQLDAHPMLLNAANGVIDLRHGQLDDHSQDLFFTKIIPWAIDDSMKTPHWDRFLSEITGGDAALMAYLQQITGYCLTASVREQCFFIFWGDGRNGKSTFIKILLEMMGSWAAQTPADTFIQRKGNTNHNDLARLFDKRLVAAIETEEGGRLAEGLIKSMAGSDRIAARQLYQEFFEYEPTFKVILTTNHKPRIKGTDFAIWRRIRLVPFTWRIPDDKVDPDIFDKLKAEMPGILAWAVKGCLEWQKIGKLESPEKVQDAIKEYQIDQDVVRRFTDEVCEVNKKCGITLKELYESYEKWCKDNGEFILSKNRVSRRLVEMGFEKKHTENGSYFTGIRLHGDELF